MATSQSQNQQIQNNDAVNSNLLKSQLSIGSDSPKKGALDKGPAPNPPLSGEAQLKYENDRLKLALAQSSANAKKWEVELSTLKNNNARLTSALQESTSNVEEWKRQLHNYKERIWKIRVTFFFREGCTIFEKCCWHRTTLALFTFKSRHLKLLACRVT